MWTIFFSDKTLVALGKHIQHVIIPPQEEDDDDTKINSAKSILPLQAVEQAIKSALSRNNYGLDSQNGLRVPAAACVWRWEVQPNHRDWLPKSAREKLEARLLERVQVGKCSSLYDITDAFPRPENNLDMDLRLSVKPREMTSLIPKARIGLPKMGPTKRWSLHCSA